MMICKASYGLFHFRHFSSEVFNGCGPLEQNSRVIFDRWKGQIGCYFELIAPYIEDLASKQSEVDVDGFNILLVASGDDLNSAIAICDVMLSEFSKHDEHWRFHHGWVTSPGLVERGCSPYISKPIVERRALDEHSIPQRQMEPSLRSVWEWRLSLFGGVGGLVARRRCAVEYNRRQPATTGRWRYL